jgi:hypothetical protein
MTWTWREPCWFCNIRLQRCWFYCICEGKIKCMTLVWYKLPLINTSVFNYRNKWYIQMYTISSLWMNFRLNTTIDLSLHFSNKRMNVLQNKSKSWCDMCHDVSECSCRLLLLLSGTIEYTWCSFSTKQVSLLYLFPRWYSSYCAHFVIHSNYILTVHTMMQL